MENDNGQILLVKENYKNINKEVYNVPVIEINKELSLIDNIKNKYIDVNIKSIINEINILDDACNEIKQINLYCSGNINTYTKDYKWIDYENIPNEIPGYINNAIDICKYNLNV